MATETRVRSETDTAPARNETAAATGTEGRRRRRSRRRPVDQVDWDELTRQVDAEGYAVTSTPLLTPSQCRQLADRFDDDALYRSTVEMARYRYGEGTYRYYRDPLPDEVAELRQAIYPRLAPLANRWQERLDPGGQGRRHDSQGGRAVRGGQGSRRVQGGQPARFPDRLDDLVELCRRAGQAKPTPLILRYEAGGYNCLHQDLYGEIAFPLQVTVALTRPGDDFTGGENLFVEQRPRAQSRGTAVTVPQGHAVVFPTRHRPVEGARGSYRVAVRHGVSTVRSGVRVTLGLIFHQAA